MKISISEDFKSLAASVGKYSEETHLGAQRAVMKSTMAVEAKAKQLAAVKSGRLRSGIHGRVLQNGLRGTVTSYAAHSAYVEYKTRAHIIRPKKAKMLKFKVNGKTVFARLVRHPGTKEQPFMRPALQQEEPLFAKELKNILGRFK